MAWIIGKWHKYGVFTKDDYFTRFGSSQSALDKDLRRLKYAGVIYRAAGTHSGRSRSTGEFFFVAFRDEAEAA